MQLFSSINQSSYTKMKFITVSMMILFFWACAYSTAAESPRLSESSIDKAFQKWMSDFDRTYANNTEMKKRREIFKKKLEFIDKFNNEGNHSYTVGLNQFSDMDFSDFSSCHDTVNVKRMFPGYFNMTDYDQFGDPAESFDWRDYGAVTPVRNQFNCGSCWAFSTVAAVESRWKIYHNQSVILSPQRLIDCDDDSSGCESGASSKAIDYITRGGIASEEAYPYRAVKGICNDEHVDSSAFVEGYRWIGPLLKDSQVMQIIARTGPLICLVHTGEDFRNYMGGIFKGPCGWGGPDQVNHSMVIIGYGKTDGESYWIVKNSWGENWGEKGYAKISMNGENCGLRDEIIFPFVQL